MYLRLLTTIDRFQEMFLHLTPRMNLSCQKIEDEILFLSESNSLNIRTFSAKAGSMSRQELIGFSRG